MQELRIASEVKWHDDPRAPEQSGSDAISAQSPGWQVLSQGYASAQD
jgi:hypothetical protein